MAKTTSEQHLCTKESQKEIIMNITDTIQQYWSISLIYEN